MALAVAVRVARSRRLRQDRPGILSAHGLLRDDGGDSASYGLVDIAVVVEHLCPPFFAAGSGFDADFAGFGMVGVGVPSCDVFDGAALFEGYDVAH